MIIVVLFSKRKDMRWMVSLVVGFCIISCSSSRTYTEVQISTLASAVSTPSFYINAQWALPLDNDAAQVLNALQPAGNVVNGNRVHIDNGTNFIKVRQDSLFVNLPYFGTRQISGGAPGNTNIEVAMALEIWRTEPSKKAYQRNLRFEARHKGEAYDIAIRLNAGGTATVIVNSSQRQSIRYTGNWE